MTPPDPDPDDRPLLVCSEASLAAMLGLMTAHAQAHGHAQRRRIARLVADNLARLAGHSALSPHFRLALAALESHWQVLERRHAGCIGHIGESRSQAESPRTH